MTPDRKSKRGRPKGTGLDDRARLASITARLANDPDRKPTTAIKSEGVTDPSAIRRLREKLKEMRREPGELAYEAPKRHRAQPLETRPCPKKSEPIAEKTSDPAPSPQTSEAADGSANSMPPNLETWFTYWCGLTLEGVNASMKFQQLYADSILKSPPVTLALGQGIAATDALISFAKGSHTHEK